MKEKSYFVLYNLLLLAGCTNPVESERVRTSGIHGSIDVIAEDNSTTVEVWLRASTGIFGESIVLSSGDLLTATMSGNTISLSKRDKLYSGEFRESVNGSVVRVSLIRDNNTLAPDSTVSLPSNFNIDAPEQGETFKRGNTITAAWTSAPVDGLVSINYKFNCRLDNGSLGFSKLYVVEDTGVHTTSIDEILNARGEIDLVNGESCPMEVLVRRTSYGDTDPALVLFSEPTAVREKSVIVNVVP